MAKPAKRSFLPKRSALQDARDSKGHRSICNEATDDAPRGVDHLRWNLQQSGSAVLVVSAAGAFMRAM